MIDLAGAASAVFGVLAVCAALGLSRATYYRWTRPMHGPARRRHQPRALEARERAQVLAALHEPRFADLAPAEVYATLLDEGVYLCSERTMYRVLAENAEIRERRNQLRHANHPMPELLATRPNELWSWDITKLQCAAAPPSGPRKTLLRCPPCRPGGRVARTSLIRPLLDSTN